MRGGIRGRVGCGVGLTALVLVLVSAPLAAAAEGFREFNGRVAKINDRKITVDNGKGDKVSFIKMDGTRVTGYRSSWEGIEKKDWVTVKWSIEDKPRRAHQVVTSPPKD